MKQTARARTAVRHAFCKSIKSVFVAGLFATLCSEASAANQPPTIGALANETVLMDQPTHAIRLTLNDAETPALSLRMSGTSSDTNLVPLENIFFGTFAPNQYVTVTPAFGQTGSATITLTVSDGTNTASTSFVLTVNPPPAGAARFASAMPMNIPDDGPANPYPSTIQVTGRSGMITNLTLTLSKLSHQYVTDLHMLLVGPTGLGVVIFSQISQGHSVSNVTVHLTDASSYPLPASFDLWPEPLRPTDLAPTNYFPAPAPAGPYGTCAFSTFNGLPANGSWSLYVYDHLAPDAGQIVGGWSMSIATTGGEDNTPPTISSVGDQLLGVNGSTPAIPFTVNDAETPVSALMVTATSSNPSLVTAGNILLGGSGANRNVAITPASGQMGAALITLSVSDGSLSNTTSFLVTVTNAFNAAPTIAALADQVVLVDQPTHAVRLALNDAETPALSLVMSADSSNPNVVPVENIFFGTFAPNQYVTVTPAFGQTGSSTITLTVSDGTNTASTSFLFTVNPPPDGTLRFVNPTPLIIPLGGPASPYPSVINVSGMSGTITNLALTLSRMSHEYVTDLHMLLVSPTGQKVVVFGSVAQGRSVHNVTVTLVDSSDYPLPQSFSLWPEPLRPTDWAVTNDFPAPAPAGPYGPVAMSSFNGTAANGVWSLYVYDDFAPDQGDISGGWSLLISTTGGANSSPTINGSISNQTTVVNSALPALPFTVDDSFTPANALVVSAASSNPALIPISNIVFGGSGSNRTVTITPAANQIGTTTITLTVSDGELAATTNFDVTVQPGLLVLNANNQTRAYGSANPELAGTMGGLLPGDTITASFTTVATAGSPVGDYSIIPVLNDPQGRLGNYIITTNQGVLTVTATPLTITANDQSRSYGAVNPSPTATVQGLLNNDPITVSCTTLADAGAPVGAYAIVPGVVGAVGNYAVTIVNGTLQINPAVLMVSADSQSRIYGAANPTLTGTISGIQNNDTITASYSTMAETNSPVGSYAIVPALSGALGNYTIAINNGTLAVTPVALTVIADDKSRAYGAANPTFTATISGFVNGEDAQVLDGALALVTTTETNSPVGQYPISAGGLVSTNYAINYSNGTLTVTAYALSITVDNQVRVYGTVNPLLTGSVAGLQNLDNITAIYATAVDMGSAVGGYPITVSLSDPDNKLGNYSITTNGGVLTITPAALTVSADNQSRTYGAANPVLTGTISGIQNNDTITASYSTMAETNSPVGSYAIVPALSGALGNYTIAINNGTLAVTPVALTVVADDKSRVYGAANPEFTASVTGFVNGEDIQVLAGALHFSTEAETNSLVGTYPIVGSGLASTNYNLIYSNGTLTVTAYELTIQINNQSRAYGATNPVLTGTLAGVQASDDITASFVTDANEWSVVGGHPIAVSLIDPGHRLGNYTVITNGGTLSITPAPLVVTVTDQSRAYGAANPELVASIAGVQNDDEITVSCSTSADAHSAVGSYAIQPMLAGFLENYAITTNAGVLTVTPASLVVSADNKSRIYGEANPGLTGTVSGIVNGDAIGVSYNTLAGEQSSVGDYAIVPQLSGLLDNYSVVTNLGMLTITPATLIVMANDQSRVYGAPNPPFTATMTGFVNGESAGVLSGSPALQVAVTAADGPAGISPTTPAGVYAIVAGPGDLAAANYTLVFSNGTLTITPADSALVLASAQNPCSTGSNVTFIASLTAAAPATVAPAGLVQFFANGSPLGAPVAATGGLATLGTGALSAGTNMVQAVYSGDGNFNGSSNSLEQIVVILAQRPNVVGIQKAAGGSVTVTCVGTPGARYLVQGIANLGTGAAWVNLSTNIAGANGQWTFTESMSNGPLCYYRAAIP